MYSYARLGFFGILAIVALRIGVGWHFYMEGVNKVRSGDFESTGFLKAAKGPLADSFQQLIWDHDGKVRLNQVRVKELFATAAKQAEKHFGLTSEQVADVNKLRVRYHELLDGVYEEAREDVFKYVNSVDRVKKMHSEAMWNEVASLRGQKEKVEAERSKSVQSTLMSVDAIWNQFERRLNGIATPTQRQAAGTYSFARPGELPLNTRIVDQILPLFDMSIGIMLMLGLLTRLAAGLAAAFLLSVVLSQMPGFPGTQPTYFQAVECLSLVVLMATGAGRFAGLDFIPWAWWNRASKIG